MHKKTRLACAIALPLLICGCQSSSMRIQPVPVTCQKPPAPAAWIMQPYAPDLTRRMLNELSESPMPAIAD
ncbi:lysis system o-spanin lipoprotein Rz1 [Pseudomonas sp. B21-015]|uniref:lysis system o-spanin lipoprotein Rz1 n=1 Tax=Pseudomonas sp. B21-015 TaxID=2895473 RepID=UPI0038D41DF7